MTMTGIRIISIPPQKQFKIKFSTKCKKKEQVFWYDAKNNYLCVVF